MRTSLSHGLFATAILFAFPAEAQQEATDMKLRSAGFKVQLATTPQQIAHLKRMPARVILSRTKDGRKVYVYADPDYCKCMMIGDENALKNYGVMPGLPGVDDVSADNYKRSSESMVIGEMDSDLGDNDIFGRPYFQD